MTDSKTQLAELQRLTDVVISQGTAERAARDRERAARRDLLAEACRVATPAVSFIGSTYVQAHEQRFTEFKWQGGDRSRSERRFVPLSQDTLAPHKTERRFNEAPVWTGRVLCLGEDGDLYEIAWTGNADEFAPEQRTYFDGVDQRIGSAEDAIEAGWSDVEGYVERLMRLMASGANGARPEQTAALDERANVSTAIMTLFRAFNAHAPPPKGRTGAKGKGKRVSKRRIRAIPR